MGFVFDKFQTSKPFRGAGFIITCLTYHSIGASDVLNTKEKKIGMLKIENYKNKSNMKINKNNDKIINNGKGGKTKKKKINTCKNKTR